MSVYWTAEVPGHPNWATDQAQGRVGCWGTGQLRFTDQAQGRVGCRCTGQLRFQATRTGLQIRRRAVWGVGVLDS